ncbi:MAG: Nif3-like dinuclear metal center hexameric protein [Firmicutes bacterium]|nr:Nif3-like dinuclear metal center hexameric protein [Bacillota bacterium]
MGTAKCQDVISLMEEIAPRDLAEDWDNVGLLIGDRNSVIKKIMVCLDLPRWVLDEAIENKIDMIITHHPVIFSSMKKINTDSSLGRKIIRLLENNISVYSSHTNMDMAKGGLNDIFAKQLGFDETTIIQPLYAGKLFKLVVYVPQGTERKVLDGLSKAGAGFIGNYSSCSFRSKGIGTFKPENGSTPFIGTKGVLEEVNEYRLETIVSENQIDNIVRELKKVHPYEEPAYDILELENKMDTVGIGRLGVLKDTTTLKSYVEFVKNALGVNSIRYAGNPNSIIKKVALINGSGNKYIKQAKSTGADVLITGDLQYHQILDALEDGLNIIDAGHFETEKIIIKEIANYLKAVTDKLGYEIEVIESKTNINPVFSI